MFEAAGRQPGDLLELCTEVRHAGISEPEGDLAEREFVVDEQFLDAFDFLGDEVLFDGAPFGFGEEGADLPVVDPQALLQVVRKPHVGHDLRLPNQPDHGTLYLLDHAGPAVFEEFEPEGFETPSELLLALRG